MTLSLLSNYAANIANRAAKQADMDMTASLRKLSVGSRVEAARDDAAAMALGTALRAEVNSLRQAAINAGQALVMLQIADSAMGKVSDILIRMKALAVQSSSGQLGSSERAKLNSEYQALYNEVDRISKTTNFNGQRLIGGDITTTMNNPYTSGQQTTATHLLRSAAGVTSLKFDSSVESGAYSFQYDGVSKLTMTNVQTSVSETITLASGAIASGTTETYRFSALGATIVLNSSFNKGTTFGVSGNDSAVSNAVAGANAANVTANTANTNDKLYISAMSGSVSGITTDSISIDATTANASVLTLAAGGGSNNFVSSAVDLSTTGAKTVELKRTVTTGLTTRTDSITVKFTVGTGFADNDVVTLTMNQLRQMANAYQSESNTAGSFSFKVGSGITGLPADNSIAVNMGSVSTTTLGLNGGDILTAASAEVASIAVDSAIGVLSTSRSKLGAAQNRLDFARANIEVAVENTEEARSSLSDLNMAQEMSFFTSKQVLQQSGIAMVAKANEVTQTLLQLFR